jgi:hypothetical protein
MDEMMKAAINAQIRAGQPITDQQFRILRYIEFAPGILLRMIEAEPDEQGAIFEKFMKLVKE